MIFAMTVARRPPSIQSGGKGKFKEFLREEARRWLDDGPMLQGDLYIRIVWFNSDRPRDKTDVDNISKPICDALGTIVYSDDSMLVKRLAHRVDSTRNYSISEPEGPSKAHDELLRLLAEKCTNIMYIEVGTVSAQRIDFGPIDGDSP